MTVNNIYFSVIYNDLPIMNVEGMELPFIIGSGDSCNLKVRDSSFSEQHIAIVKQGKNILVKDLTGSESIQINFTQVNEFAVVDAEVFSIKDILTCEIGYLLEEEHTELTQAEILAGQTEQNLDEMGIEKSQISVEDLEKTIAAPIELGVDEEKTKVHTLTEKQQRAIQEKMKKRPLAKKPMAPAELDGKLSLRSKNSIVEFEKPPLLDPYPVEASLERRIRSLEANLMWKGTLLSSRQISMGEKLIVGPDADAPVEIPQFPKYRELARLSKKGLRVNIPSGMPCKLLSKGETWEKVTYNPHVNKSRVYLGDEDLFVIQFDKDTYLYLRKIPATIPLSDRGEFDKELAVWESFLTSGFAHLALLLSLIILAPEVKDVPQLKDVPKRYAKLLVKKEPPKPEVKKPEPPKPKPEPPKPEVKKPEPKKPKAKPKPKKDPIPKPKAKKPKARPKQVVVKKSSKKINQLPLKLKSRSVKKSSKGSAPAKKQQTLNPADLGGFGALLQSPVPSTNVGQVKLDNTAPSKPQAGIPDIAQLDVGNTDDNVTGGVQTTGAGVGDASSYGGVSGNAGNAGVEGETGRPEMGNFSTTNGLSQKQVLSVINANVGKIQRCYERALISDSSLAGRVEYEWTISASGRVSSAKVKKAELKGDGSVLNPCVLKLLKSLKFPKAKNGQSTTTNIGFPFGRY